MSMTDNSYLYPYFLKNSPDASKNNPNQHIETGKKPEPKKKEGGSQNERAAKQ